MALAPDAGGHHRSLACGVDLGLLTPEPDRAERSRAHIVSTHRFPSPPAYEVAPGAQFQTLLENVRLLRTAPLDEALPVVLRHAALLAGATAAAFVRFEGAPSVATFPPRQSALELKCTHLSESGALTRGAIRARLELDLGNGRLLGEAMLVPIVGRTTVLGTLTVCGPPGHIFYLQDEQPLEIVAANLAQAIDVLHLVDEVERHDRTLTGLHSIGKSLTTAETSQHVLRHIVDTALTVLAADFLVLYEYIRSEDDVRMPPIYAGSVRQPAVLERRGAVISHRDSAVFKLLSSRGPVYAPDAVRDWHELGVARRPGSVQNFLERESVVSSAGIPLRLEDEALGVLFVNYRTPQRFAVEQQEQIEIIASQGAAAISLARNLEGSRRHAARLGILTEVGLRLNSAVTLQTTAILAQVHTEVGRLLSAANLYVVFYNQDRDAYSVPFSTDAPDGLTAFSESDLRKSLAALVIREGKPRRVDEAAFAELRRKGVAEGLGQNAKIWLGAPMIARGKVRGMIAVQDYTNPHAYDEDDLTLLAAIANQAATALDNAQLLQGLQRELQAQTGLPVPLERAVSQFQDLQDLQYVLLAILERAVADLASDGGLIFLRDREPDTIRVGVTCNWPELKGRRLRFGQAFAGTIAGQGKRLFNNDYQHWPEKAPLFNHQEHGDRIGALIGVPVVANAELLGVVVLTSRSERRRAYSEADLDLLDRLVAPIAIAVGNARRVSFQRAMVDDSPYPVIAANTSAVLTTFNAAAEQLTGYKREEVLQRHLSTLYMNGVLESAKIGQKLGEQDSVRMESVIKGKNDERIPVLLSAAVLRDEQGAPLGSIAILEDLRIAALTGIRSRLLAALEEIDRPNDLRQLADVIAQQAVLLLKADDGALFLEAGAGFRRHLNRRGPRPRGHLFVRAESPAVKELLAGEAPTLALAPSAANRSAPSLSHQQTARLLIRIESTDQLHGILVLESMRSSSFLFEPHLLSIFASRCAAALKRVQLASGRARVEEALIRFGSTIAAAQMSRIVVHEVKNALTSLFLTLRSVRRLAATSQAPEGLAKKLDVVDREITRLDALTTRLREFSSGRLLPEKSDVFLNEIVRQTVDVLDSSIERRGVEYRLHLDPQLDRSVEKQHAKVLRLDQAQMAQVIINLTQNALDACAPGDQIEFSTRLEAGQAWLEVTDTGKGMQQAQRRRIFDPNFSTKRGAGLGLFISQLIVHDNHHGQISASSKPGQGTRISIVLPLSNEGGL